MNLNPEIGLQILQLNWQDTGVELQAEMSSYEDALKLIRDDQTRKAIALLAQNRRYALVRICYPGMRKGLEVLSSFAVAV